MERERFQALVRQALDSLPEDFRLHLDNVAVVIEDRPPPGLDPGDDVEEGPLLGLYEGHPLPERSFDFDLALPDKITIFQVNVESICASDDEIRHEVRLTVLHEIAHHFGIDDDRLDELDY
jgi:predicted Zn-dependent protease with MMP-like domain